MQTPSQEQLDRLPKWASSYIAGLEKRLAESRKVVAELRQGPADSTVRIQHHDEPDQLLGRDTPIVFDVLQAHLSQGTKPTSTRINVGHIGPFTLEIRSDNGQLHVIPQASNTIKVRAGSWS